MFTHFSLLLEPLCRNVGYSYSTGRMLDPKDPILLVAKHYQMLFFDSVLPPCEPDRNVAVYYLFILYMRKTERER